jgi:hypothetical protein
VSHTVYIVGLHKGAEAAILQVHSYQIFTLEIFVAHVRLNHVVCSECWQCKLIHVMDNPKCVRTCVSRQKPGQSFAVRKLVIDFVLCHSTGFERSKD